MQAASDTGNAAALVFFAVRPALFARRDARSGTASGQEGAAPRSAVWSQPGVAVQRSPSRARAGVLRKACELSLEGIVSKRTDAPYVPGNRGPPLSVPLANRRNNR